MPSTVTDLLGNMLDEPSTQCGVPTVGVSERPHRIAERIRIWFEVYVYHSAPKALEVTWLRGYFACCEIVQYSIPIEKSRVYKVLQAGNGSITMDRGPGTFPWPDLDFPSGELDGISTKLVNTSAELEREPVELLNRGRVRDEIHVRRELSIASQAKVTQEATNHDNGPDFKQVSGERRHLGSGPGLRRKEVGGALFKALPLSIAI
jgi:hypothetical protein